MNRNDFIKKQIADLENADIAALKGRFRELYGFECGATNAKNLRSRIAYKMQELYFGGLSDADKAMLDAIADKDPAANLRAEGMKPRVFVKGTRLCRDWKGKTYCGSCVSIAASPALARYETASPPNPHEPTQPGSEFPSAAPSPRSVFTELKRLGPSSG